MWALAHQHQPPAPFRSETPTHITWVYTDISKVTGKSQSSLLLFMFISAKLLLQRTPREPPLHSMLSHFYSDCKNSHWAEHGLGRSLSRCFWGCRYPATDGVPWLWSADAISLPRLPREVPSSASNGVGDLTSKETGYLLQGTPPHPWNSASQFWSKRWQVKLQSWALEICLKDNWNPQQCRKWDGLWKIN